MNYLRPKPRQAGPTGAILRHLFTTTLARQLLPENNILDVRVADGYATIWLPEAGLAITSLESISPVAGIERARAAEMLGIDLLVMDLSRHGDLVECELELCGERRAQKFAADRLALWVSPQGVAALVPYRPRNQWQVLPPSFAMSHGGISLIDDPFADNATWLDGVTRASDAAINAVAFKAGTLAPEAM